MKWDTKLEDVSAQTKYPIGDGDHGAIKPEMYQNHGVPYIRVGDIKWDGRIDRSKMVYISEEVNKLNPKSFLYPGDIIISKTGATIGKVAIIPTDFTISNTTASIGKVSLDFTKANSRFVFWCMKSQNFQEQMWKVSHKSAQPGFNVKDLKIFKIPLPPLPTQQKIASILDAADTLRQKDKALLAKYDELTQALFLDMFGDPVSNPKGWDKVELKKLGKVITGSTPPSSKENMFGGNIPFVTPGDLDKYQPYKRFVTEEGALNSRTVNRGSLFVCCIGATIGKTGIARELSSFNQQINAVSWSIFINSQFGYNCFFYMKNELIKKAISTTLPIMKKSEFEKLKMIAPPFELQTQFAERVTMIEEQKAIAQASLEKSEELFNSLLQKAFKGELV